MLPFFTHFHDEKFQTLTSDDQIEKIIQNYKDGFVEKYDFWKELIQENINNQYELLVDKLLATSDVEGIKEKVYVKLSYDEFCIDFLEILKEELYLNREWSGYTIIGVFNTIISKRIMDRLAEFDDSLWDNFFNNMPDDEEDSEVIYLGFKV